MSRVKTQAAKELTTTVPLDDSKPSLVLVSNDDRSAGLVDVYKRLRANILSGAIGPGAILNQVHIAKTYGVSRTPVREALRMLQAEGLVDGHFQHRLRVTSVSAEEVDAVYASWIVMQSLGIAITVPKITKDELQLIRSAYENMEETPHSEGRAADWEASHVLFHQRLVMHAGPIISSAIDNCWSRSERARKAYMRSAPQSWLDSEMEHEAIVEAYALGRPLDAIHIASKQLMRIALIVMGTIDPTYEPRAIRQALGMMKAPESV
ncbi:MAG: GntR family transcriptional regulator [Pseudomonadota bacterium]